ncbi:MAG: 3'-5' exonuclease [Minisyncoccia bacterium]|jgi:DNA polymerase III alpha subunit (gram-positive type)
MDYLKRPLAITDTETTGLDAQIHEIIEIGLIVVDQQSFKILDKLDVKVKPVHIKTGVKKALEFTGYNEKDWKKAWDLEEVMKIYAEKTKDAIFTAQNTYSDWAFINEAFKLTGVEDPMDYHRLDLFSIGWAKRDKFPDMTKFSLSSMCKYFGIEVEPIPHRAMNGAKKELEVLKHLMKN